MNSERARTPVCEIVSVEYGTPGPVGTQTGLRAEIGMNGCTSVTHLPPNLTGCVMLDSRGDDSVLTIVNYDNIDENVNNSEHSNFSDNINEVPPNEGHQLLLSDDQGSYDEMLDVSSIGSDSSRDITTFPNMLALSIAIDKEFSLPKFNYLTMPTVTRESAPEPLAVMATKVENGILTYALLPDSVEGARWARYDTDPYEHDDVDYFGDNESWTSEDDEKARYAEPIEDVREHVKQAWVYCAVGAVERPHRFRNIFTKRLWSFINFASYFCNQAFKGDQQLHFLAKLISNSVCEVFFTQYLQYPLHFDAPHYCSRTPIHELFFNLYELEYDLSEEPLSNYQWSLSRKVIRDVISRILTKLYDRPVVFHAFDYVYIAKRSVPQSGFRDDLKLGRAFTEYGSVEWTHLMEFLFHNAILIKAIFSGDIVLAGGILHMHHTIYGTFKAVPAWSSYLSTVSTDLLQSVYESYEGYSVPQALPHVLIVIKKLLGAVFAMFFELFGFTVPEKLAYVVEKTADLFSRATLAEGIFSGIINALKELVRIMVATATTGDVSFLFGRPADRVLTEAEFLLTSDKHIRISPTEEVHLTIEDRIDRCQRIYKELSQLKGNSTISQVALTNLMVRVEALIASDTVKCNGGDKTPRPFHLLIMGPPAVGKNTVLRDLNNISLNVRGLTNSASVATIFGQNANTENKYVEGPNLIMSLINLFFIDEAFSQTARSGTPNPAAASMKAGSDGGVSYERAFEKSDNTMYPSVFVELTNEKKIKTLDYYVTNSYAYINRIDFVVDMQYKDPPENGAFRGDGHKKDENVTFTVGRMVPCEGGYEFEAFHDSNGLTHCFLTKADFLIWFEQEFKLHWDFGVERMRVFGDHWQKMKCCEGKTYLTHKDKCCDTCDFVKPKVRIPIPPHSVCRHDGITEVMLTEDANRLVNTPPLWRIGVKPPTNRRDRNVDDVPVRPQPPDFDRAVDNLRRQGTNRRRNGQAASAARPSVPQSGFVLPEVFWLLLVILAFRSSLLAFFDRVFGNLVVTLVNVLDQTMSRRLTAFKEDIEFSAGCFLKKIVEDEAAVERYVVRKTNDYVKRTLRVDEKIEKLKNIGKILACATVVGFVGYKIFGRKSEETEEQEKKKEVPPPANPQMEGNFRRAGDWPINLDREAFYRAPPIPQRLNWGFTREAHVAERTLGGDRFRGIQAMMCDITGLNGSVWALKVAPQVILCNGHALRDMHEAISLKIDDRPIILPKHRVYFIPGKDLALIQVDVPAKSNVSDIPRYFIPKTKKQMCAGKLLSRTDVIDVEWRPLTEPIIYPTVENPWDGSCQKQYETQFGDCGFIAVDDNGSIFGIHSFEGGVVQHVDRALLDKAIKELAKQNIMPMITGGPAICSVTQAYLGKCVDFSPRCPFLWTPFIEPVCKTTSSVMMDCNFLTRKALAHEFVESKIIAIKGEDFSAPTSRRKFDPKLGFKANGVERALYQIQKKTPLHIAYLEAATMRIMHRHNQHSFPKLAPFNAAETASRMKGNTAAGPIWGKTKKKHVVEGFFEPEYEASIIEIQNILLTNSAACLSSLSLKDEPRPKSKVETGQIRVFEVYGALNVVGLSLLGPIFEYLYTCGHVFGYRVGLNVMSGDWGKIYNRMVARGAERILAMDAVAYDKTIRGEFAPYVALVFKNLARLVGYSEDNQIRVYNVILSKMYRFIKAFEEVGWIVDSNGSGAFDTTFFNIIVMEILLNSAWMSIYPKADYYEKTTGEYFGDDSLSSVDPGYEKFNQVSVKEFAEAYMGIEFVSCRKDARLDPYEHISTVTFLKRYFRVDNGEVKPPLEKLSVYKMLGWWTPKPDSKINVYEHFDEVSHNALNEAYLHGEDFYNEIREICNKCASKNGLPFAPKEYLEIDALYRKGEMQLWDI